MPQARNPARFAKIFHETAQFGIDLARWIDGSVPRGVDHVRQGQVSVTLKKSPALSIDIQPCSIRSEALRNPGFVGPPKHIEDFVIQFMVERLAMAGYDEDRMVPGFGGAVRGNVRQFL